MRGLAEMLKRMAVAPDTPKLLPPAVRQTAGQTEPEVGRKIARGAL